MRHGRQLVGRDVDAELLEAEGVLLGRQAKISTRLGQNLLLYPRVVLSELLLQFSESFLVAIDLVLLEQLADSVDEKVGARQVGLHLDLRRPELSGLGPVE